MNEFYCIEFRIKHFDWFLELLCFKFGLFIHAATEKFVSKPDLHGGLKSFPLINYFFSVFLSFSFWSTLPLFVSFWAICFIFEVKVGNYSLCHQSPLKRHKTEFYENENYICETTYSWKCVRYCFNVSLN